MTLRERNLVIECLETIRIHFSMNKHKPLKTLADIDRALEIMKRQPLSSPGLPVSAGGDPEEPRYCVECGEPVFEDRVTCGKTECALKRADK